MGGVPALVTLAASRAGWRTVRKATQPHFSQGSSGISCAYRAVSRNNSPQVSRGGPEGATMKSKWIIAVIISAGVIFLGAAAAAAQSYNPIHWIKKGPTASEQLAANKDQSKKLASELQAILPPRTKLEDASTSFKELSDCVSALHVSHNLNLNFNCLNRYLTAAHPTSTFPSS